MCRAAALLLLAALAVPALAQTSILDDEEGRLAAVPAPGATVAGGEEPAAIQANAAAPGFVAAPSFQYLHEQRHEGRPVGDAVFLTAPLGRLVPTLALDWLRPPGAPRFRRATVGLALSDHRAFSVGGAWSWVQSPDGALDRVESHALGLTVRPARWLSLGASADGLGARLAGERLPARLLLGAGVRTARDRVTLTLDLVASDRGTGLADLDPRALALGGSAELWRGLVLFAQLQAPVRADGDPVALTGLTWNGPRSGATLGVAARPGRDGWVGGLRSSAEAYRSAPPAPSRAADVDLARELSPPRSLLFPGPRDPFGRLLRRLAALRHDPSVGAVVVRVDPLDLGLGRLGELRGAIAAIAAEKPVVAYLRGGRLPEYWLASAAGAIRLPPAAQVDVSGLSASTPFLRGGLARLGVAFEVVAAGRYKSAPDPLVRDDMSEAQREAQGENLDALFGRVVSDVARARGLPEARVRGLVDQAILTSEEAAAAGLVDGPAWPDELERLASERAGRTLALGGGGEARPREARRWGPRPGVAVVPLEGAIVMGRGGGSPLGGTSAGADVVAELLDRAAKDPSVKAIVLRVDSPGGDALASDLVWRAVVRARERKPVVVSMGDAAASGGYLAAVGADEIVAEPATLTGSIGVFAVKPDLSALLGKLGVNVVTLRRGEKADLRSAARGWTPGERALLERQIRAFYDGFKARVAAGRRLSAEQVEAVAGGRVWTGAQAKERGLVDRLGSLADAIERAKERAGLAGDEDVDVRRIEPPRRFLEGITRFAGEEPDPLARLGRAVPELAAAALLLEMGELVALPPAWLGVGAR